MRWNDLFADLEGQMGAAEDAQFAADVAERTRGERATVAMGARLAAASGHSIVVTLSNGDSVTGRVADTAASWVLLNEDARQSWVPLQAIDAVAGLPTRSTDLPVVARRLSMGHALRALARIRANVVVITRQSQYSGVISAVGADYAELADLESRQAKVVPFAAMVRVSSTSGGQ